MKITAIIFVLLMTQMWPVKLGASGNISDADVKSALKELDGALSMRDIYVAGRQERIDSLSHLIATDTVGVPVALSMLMELGDSYNGYRADSAIAVYSRGEVMAREHGDLGESRRFELKKLVNMSLMGLGAEAVQNFGKIIDGQNIPDSLKADVYGAGRQLYSYHSLFFPRDSEAFRHWNERSVEMLRRLLDILPDSTDEYTVREGELYWYSGHPSEARAILREYLDGNPANRELAAIAANILARIYKSNDNDNGELYYLAKSAVYDIRNATRETVSLHELGASIFEHGDPGRAHQYLNIALADAVECNAPVRMLQSSAALPVIAEAHLLQERRVKNWTMGAFLVMVMLLVGMLLMYLRLRTGMRRMRQLQDGLANANRVKEMYISQFLGLCTTYMDKLHQFCKIAERKMSTGHTDELYKLVTSGRFAEEQSQEFYNTFDRAFLHIYPDFVSEVNKLFKPEDKIVLAEGELLNADLRILAFMRLGVEDSARIAQVLNYSVHTIYAYRNRLRNRAIHRETLEEDVKKIGTVE